MKEETLKFADRLRQARTRAKISQEQLAHRLGLSKAAVSKYESGSIHEPSSGTLFQLADLLGVDPRWLATGKTEKGDHEMPEQQLPLWRAFEKLPKDVRDPLHKLIISHGEQAEQRYWRWVREQEL